MGQLQLSLQNSKYGVCLFIYTFFKAVQDSKPEDFGDFPKRG